MENPGKYGQFLYFLLHHHIEYKELSYHLRFYSLLRTWGQISIWMSDHWPPFTPRLTYFHTVVWPIQFGPSSSFRTVKHSSSYVFVCFLPPADGRVIADDDRIYLFAFVLILSGCHHFFPYIWSSSPSQHHTQPHNSFHLFPIFTLSHISRTFYNSITSMTHKSCHHARRRTAAAKKTHREKVPIHRAKLENQFNCSASRRAQAEQKTVCLEFRARERGKREDRGTELMYVFDTIIKLYWKRQNALHRLLSLTHLSLVCCGWVAHFSTAG